MNEILDTIVTIIAMTVLVFCIAIAIRVLIENFKDKKQKPKFEDYQRKLLFYENLNNDLYRKIDMLNFEDFDKFLNTFDVQDKFTGFYYTCKIMRDLNREYEKMRNDTYDFTVDDKYSFNREYFIGRAIVQDCVNTGMNIERLIEVIKGENHACEYLFDYSHSKIR